VSTVRSTVEDDPPTPEPGSAIVRGDRNERLGDALVAAVDEARSLYGSETSDAWFEALADGTHPLCRIATPGSPDDRRSSLVEADRVTDPAMLEAAQRYAGERTHDLELEDDHAGRHPLQQPRPAP
jgi:hypothetical protein